MKHRLIRLAATMYASAAFGYVFLSDVILRLAYGYDRGQGETVWSGLFALQTGALLGAIGFYAVPQIRRYLWPQKRVSLFAPMLHYASANPQISKRIAIILGLIVLVWGLRSNPYDSRLVGHWQLSDGDGTRPKGVAHFVDLRPDGVGEYRYLDELHRPHIGAIRWRIKDQKLFAWYSGAKSGRSTMAIRLSQLWKDQQPVLVHPLRYIYNGNAYSLAPL